MRASIKINELYTERRLMCMDFISPEVKRQMQQNQANRQIEINASKMQFDSRAEQVAYYLYEEIRDYQNNLPDTEDVAMSIVQFNQSITILVKEIGYIGYNLVCFHGEDTSGKPLELIQHVQQLNFLLMVVPKPEIEAPNRQIGFVGQVEE